MDMKNKKYIIALLAAGCIGLSGCGYSELPPKTSDASKSYIKPKGEIPTKEETDEVKAIKAEYEAAVKAAE